MKIILLKDVKKIGKKYEIKEVADGYALNSLIPSDIAVPATSSYIKLIEAKKKQSALMREDFKKAYEYAVNKLPEGKLHVGGKVNEKGHLFAGIHPEQIIEEFKKEMMMEEAIASAELAGAGQQNKELDALIRDLTKVHLPKSLVRKLVVDFLSLRNQQLKERLEGMKIEIPSYHKNHPTVSERIGFNKGLDEYIKLLENN